MKDILTLAQLDEIQREKRRNKYRAIVTQYGGRAYASKREAARAAELDLLMKAGEVVGWLPQYPYSIIVNGICVCKYFADFRVVWADGRVSVEDTKGMKTPLYKLKKKLLAACYGISIEEK